MELGTGIEVREEGERVCVLMPAVPQACKRRRGRELVDLWVFAFVMAAGGLGAVVWFGVGLVRHWPFRDWVDWALTTVAGLVDLTFGTMCLASVVIWLFPNRGRRRGVVIDRRGVQERAWGPMDLWRVRLKEIRGVVVRRPRGKMAEGLAAGEVWARVAIVSRAGGRSVSGVYPYAVAMEAAREIAANVSRMRAAAFGAAEGEVQVQDEMEGAPLERSWDGVSVVYGAQFERCEGGIRVELGRLFRDRGPQPEEGFLVMADQKVWMFPALMGVMMVGVGVWPLGAAGDIAGKMLAGMAFCGLWGWMVWLYCVRVTYVVGRWGVERRMRLFAWERLRRWKREEIRSLTLRMRGIGRGRVWEVGLSLMNGRRVAIVMGPQWTAEAFAKLVEREVGMVEMVGGDGVWGGSG